VDKILIDDMGNKKKDIEHKKVTRTQSTKIKMKRVANLVIMNVLSARISTFLRYVFEMDMAYHVRMKYDFK